MSVNRDLVPVGLYLHLDWEPCNACVEALETCQYRYGQRGRLVGYLRNWAVFR